MIKTALINSYDDNLLKLYSKNYLEQAQNIADSEYLKNSKVRIFYERSKENMVAGYCIYSGPNYRTFLPLPAITLQKINQEQGFDINPPHEVACLWIDKSLRKSKWIILLFSMMVLDVLKMRSAPIIFGTHRESIKNYFSIACPDLVFYKKLFVETKGEECDFWIMRGSKSSFVRCLFTLSTVRVVAGYEMLKRFKFWVAKKHPLPENEKMELNHQVQVEEMLALNGGKPIRSTPWPTYDKGNVTIDDEDLEGVAEVIKGKRLFRYDNRRIDETRVGVFEQELRTYFNVNYALAVSSGTAALTLPLLALQLPQDSLVGCPTFSFTATPSAIIQARLKPMMIEVDENLHMDLNDLERKITQLKALVVVHMRGFPAPLPKILELAKKHGVPVIEDSVPSLGHKYQDQHLGTFGLAGAFSTQSDKSLNTGEGGFILTNDKDLYMKCIILSGAYERLFEKHFPGQIPPINFTSIPLFNFRLDEIRGALASSQLKKLTKRLESLSKNYAYIANRIKNLKLLKLREGWQNDIYPIGDNLLFRIDGSEEDRCWFANALSAEGIDTKFLGDPHKVNVRRFWDWAYLFHGMSADEIKRQYLMSFKHISSYVDLALSPTLNQNDLEECIQAIHKVYSHYESRVLSK